MHYNLFRTEFDEAHNAAVDIRDYSPLLPETPAEILNQRDHIFSDTLMGNNFCEPRYIGGLWKDVIGRI